MILTMLFFAHGQHDRLDFSEHIVARPSQIVSEIVRYFHLRGIGDSRSNLPGRFRRLRCDKVAQRPNARLHLRKPERCLWRKQFQVCPSFGEIGRLRHHLKLIKIHSSIPEMAFARLFGKASRSVGQLIAGMFSSEINAKLSPSFVPLQTLSAQAHTGSCTVIRDYSGNDSEQAHYERLPRLHLAKVDGPPQTQPSDHCQGPNDPDRARHSCESIEFHNRKLPRCSVFVERQAA